MTCISSTEAAKKLLNRCATCSVARGDTSTLIGTRSLATNLRIGKLFMSAITKRRISRVLAGTKIGGLAFISGKGFRRKSAAGMRAITKWLFAGAAAGTKVIVLSCFKIYSYWAIGSDNWLGHGVLLVQIGSFAPLSLARAEPTGQNFARLSVT